MAEKRRKIVNTVFVLLIIATLVLGVLFCLWAFIEDRDNNDAKIMYALAAIILPILAFFVFSSEVFLWRSVVFLVSYSVTRSDFLVTLPQLLPCCIHTDTAAINCRHWKRTT